MVEVNLQDLTVVNYIINTHPLNPKRLKKMGLEAILEDEEDDYLSEDFVMVSEIELKRFLSAAENVQVLAKKAMQKIVRDNLWEEMSIPPNARRLIAHSVQYEMGQQLVGRLDFAGGLDNLAIKLLEFNADTCTLLPETAYIQNAHYEQEKKHLFAAPYNELFKGLVKQFQYILSQNPRKEKTLLVSTMGYYEDWLNTDVVVKAAQQAGFDIVHSMVLDKVIFSHDEGIFVEIAPDNFQNYQFWYKMIPWEFIADEEPELMNILEKIVMGNLATILNPAYTMLMQSKAIMKIMYEMEPSNPYLLKTTYDENAFRNKHYVKKPVFGRLGENINFYNGGIQPAYSTEGDYGMYTKICQELAYFNEDIHLNRYQPSIFLTQNPSALCFRRQDDLIIDDDAEFVSHTIQK